MAYKVFISAIYQEMALALDLARRLKEVGVSVFWGGNIGAQKAMDRALREADEVVVLLTPLSVNNPLVLFDMGAAFGQHKRVTPIIIGFEPDKLPPLIKQMPYVEYADLHDYIADLQKRAKAPEPQPA